MRPARAGAGPGGRGRVLALLLLLTLRALLPPPAAAAPPSLHLDSLRQLRRWPVPTQVRLLTARATPASGRLLEPLLQAAALAPAVRQELLLHLVDHYFFSNRPSLAALRGQESRQLAIGRQDSAGRSKAGAVLSYAYSLLKQPGPALTYAHEAARYAQGPGRRGQLVRAYNMLSIAASLAGDHALELRAELQSLRLARLSHDPVNVAIGLQNLVQIYLDLGRYALAARYLDSARARNRVLAPTERVGMPLLEAQLASHAGQHRRAVRLLLPLVRQARRDSTQYSEAELLPVLIPVLGRLGRHREALAYQQRLGALQNHFSQETTLRQAQELQAIYETERRERELAGQRRAIAALRARARRRAAAARWQLLALAAAAVLGAGGLLYAQRRRRRARTRRVADLRTRIAADLHDEVGTLLTRVSMQAELLRDTQLPADRPALDRLLTNSRAAAGTMRDIVWGIDAQADTVGSLLDRMRDHLDQSTALGGLHTALHAEGLREDAPLGAEVRQQLYLIFKEAVTNAVRHARHATRLHVALRQLSGQLHLLVEDDGPPATAPAGRSGLGLRSMRQRAAAVGGTLAAGPVGPAGGWRVEARLPV